MSKSDSAADNNVLTNFQPMSKRFMVWDKESKRFMEFGEVYDVDTSNAAFSRVFDWKAIPDIFSEDSINITADFELVQSTNLFDKDGKEIFEGSIVKWLDSKTGIGLGEGIVRIQDGMTFIERPSYDLYPDWDEEKENLVLVGHILSNPELMEEKE